MDRPLNEWMTDNILALKAIRRKNWLIWRKTRITINFNIYYDSCIAVKKAVFDTFQPLSSDVLASIIHKLNRTTCGLDPFPTKLLMSHLSSIINIILRIVNLGFSSGDFPASCKSVIISPLIKKQGLDSEILKNYRPVANISLISKIIEKLLLPKYIVI